MSSKEAECYYSTDTASHLQSLAIRNYDVLNPLDIASMRKGNRRTKRFLEIILRDILSTLMKDEKGGIKGKYFNVDCSGDV